MPVMQLDGHAVSYQLDGNPAAPCLTFSNSLGTDFSMWQGQIALLQRDFRILRYDTRGHGASACHSGPVTLELLGQDVLKLLDALAIERTHFCGLSMGGMIAQWLAIHAPQRLDRLVLANTAARIGQQQAWLERAALVRAGGLNAVADGAAGRWFTPAFAQRAPQRVAALVAGLRHANAEGYAACCEALAAADLRGRIADIKLASLLIAGESDPVTTTADARAMQQSIAGAELVTLPASHISNIEAETAFNQALREFLLR
ncbi:3-oxoadipate enol-lactonase [Duganella qianjiadongensis]|uniref:3-oxoadipate enol-lactonase n=1 Tax=Duganella qianjiadongensis TaxID=2692176 RepID=A0ABW9VH42_9BURK|nr:3-oxoadipate enol-lactonase [Duganella qianjiadongensis]MYM37899.1 3-oxoadipate enol-lactonase [Duganella qianjiadongensis]